MIPLYLEYCGAAKAGRPLFTWLFRITESLNRSETRFCKRFESPRRPLLWRTPRGAASGQCAPLGRAHGRRGARQVLWVLRRAHDAIAGQPFDVASSDRHTVKPWLADRTTVSASIVDLAPKGFPLVGGRVAVIDRIPTPTLVYRHNEHLVAVTELPLRAKGASGTGAIDTIDGYHVARWSDANLAYVAVSDMDETALGEFVEAFRRGGGPATEPSRP